MFTNPTAFEMAKEEIAYAYEKTGFFRKHMDDCLLNVDEIRTHHDFRRIPFTEKKHYRKNFPAGVLAEGFSLNNLELHRVQSSGTTGERLVTMEVGILYLQRALESLSVNPALSAALTAVPRRHIRYAAPNCSDVECANPNSTMKDRILKDGTLVLSVYHDLMTTPDRMLEMNLAEIREYAPQLYYVDPTHLAFLLRYAKRHGIEPYKTTVLSSYTMGTHTAKRQIREVLGPEAPVIDAFAMSELGWFAVECPHGCIHLNNSSFYMELVTNGRPAEPGEYAELFITTLDNGATPHIRYRTGDIFTWQDTKCTCGSPFPVVHIEGRLRNFIHQDEKIALSPRQLDDLIGAPVWLDVYKLEQTDEDDLIFSYVPNELYQAGSEAYIREGILSRLKAGTRLRMEKTTYISTERSGKFISCVSAVGDKISARG